MPSNLRPGAFRSSRRLLPLAAVVLLAAHVRPAGAAWQTGGTPLTPVPVYPQSFALQTLLADGGNGAFTVWLMLDPDTETDRYRYTAQRVTALGNRSSGWLLAGSNVWPDEGLVSPYLPRTLALVSDGGPGALHAHLTRAEAVPTRFQMYRIAQDGTVSAVPGYGGETGGDEVHGAAAASDGAGGIVVLEVDLAGALVAKRIDATGTTRWGPATLSSAQPTEPVAGAVMADGGGGVFVAWTGGSGQLVVQHLDASGATFPGWPAAGIVAGTGFAPHLASDGAGGVFIQWVQADVSSHWRVQVHHVLADATLHAGIPDGGRELPDSEVDGSPAARLVADGQGGAYVARFDSPPLTPNAIGTIRLHHFDAAIQPIPGWPANGIALTNQSTANPVTGLLADGTGGVYVSFRNGIGPAAPRGFYAQHLAADGTIAPGWPAAPGLRLSDTGEGSDLVRSGFGVIVAWNDTRLSRPGVYAQRIDLDPLTAGIDDPPVANATLALEAPRPNPSRQGVTLALALPDERPARLDVLDLAGRRIATRDLAGLGPGRHVIALPEIERLGAGLYLIQLQQRAGIRQTKLLRLR